jgi:hypothetical protein
VGAPPPFNDPAYLRAQRRWLYFGLALLFLAYSPFFIGYELLAALYAVAVYGPWVLLALIVLCPRWLVRQAGRVARRYTGRSTPGWQAPPPRSLPDA